jgi:hypothetical protein
VDALNGKALTFALSGKNEEAFLLFEKAVLFNPRQRSFAKYHGFYPTRVIAEKGIVDWD